MNPRRIRAIYSLSSCPVSSAIKTPLSSPFTLCFPFDSCLQAAEIARRSSWVPSPFLLDSDKVSSSLSVGLPPPSSPCPCTRTDTRTCSLHATGTPRRDQSCAAGAELLRLGSTVAPGSEGTRHRLHHLCRTSPHPFVPSPSPDTHGSTVFVEVRSAAPPRSKFRQPSRGELSPSSRSDVGSGSCGHE